MKLYLLRHTKLNIEKGICYGHSDVDVGPSFLDELEIIKTKLADIDFDRLYCSPLQRCYKLAESLGVGEVMTDDRLKELHFGDWEMKRWDDIPRVEFDEWANDYASLSPPNGETFAELHKRARHFVEELKPSHVDMNVLIVAHGGFIRALLAEVLNIPLKGLFRFEIDYGSVTQLNFENEIPRIGYINR